MNVRVSPREVDTIKVLLRGEADFALVRGKKMESAYLFALAKKFEVE